MIKLVDLLIESKADEIESTIRQSFLMNRGSFNTGWKMPKRQYIGLIKSLKKRYGSLVDKIVKELEKYDYIEPRGSQVVWNDGIESFGSILSEGIRDPGIFKGIFLAGGPGSGKSYVAQQLFGIPETINVSTYGLKMVNQDQELELFLNKFYGPRSGADSTVDYLNIQAYPPELFKQLTDPTFDDYAGLRGSAKYLSRRRMSKYLEGRLGVIIDGTGHKYNSIKNERQDLVDLGYDTYMVFVTTSLEVAQERNESRPRKLPADLVEKSWKNVQKNMAFFQGLFGGSNFLIVDNNKHLSPEEAKKKFKMLVEKGIKKFINKPVKSKIAKKWIAQQKLVPKKDLKQMLKK